MSTTTTSTSTSLSTILGAVVLTGVIGALFFGAACIQTYNYYHTYRADRLILKAAVASLWAVDAVHIAVYTYTIWYYVVVAFDTAWIPQVMNWSFKLSVWLSVALVLLLDLFYTVYLYKLAPTRIAPLLVFLAVAAGNIVAVVLGVRIIIFTHFTGIYDISRSALIYLFFILFCVKSVAIAVYMTAYLSCPSEWFSRESDSSLVRRAIKLVLGSGLFVAICSFCVLACHLAMPHSMSCVVVYMVVSKVYHTSFLSLLAARPERTGPFNFIQSPRLSIKMAVPEAPVEKGNGSGRERVSESTAAEAAAGENANGNGVQVV
ncbi:hypothetical protein B0H11DRAFT_2292442 [Mycena galericulata]|nr:hypothetical protein B0H11DRAFT_2292442 [Mycena galericulata]